VAAPKRTDAPRRARLVTARVFGNARRESMGGASAGYESYALFPAAISVMIPHMKKSGILALSAIAIVLGACSSSPAPVDKAAVEKSVKDVEASMTTAIAAKDAAAFAANYTADAILMTPGMPDMKGNDAIRAGMANMLADPNLKLDAASDRVEVATLGDMAATHGTYTLTATDSATKKPIHDHGSYVTVFRKQGDGSWKAVLDINTSEVPPAAPQAAKATARKRGKRR
jgi:uncharacterized protein (TIGR02246 family)